MNRTLAQGRWEAGIARLAVMQRRPLIAGALSGVASGIALGAITGPIGVVFGMWLGVGVGLMAGYVLAREDETRSVRTQELDSIIGITRGSLGAGRLSAQVAGAESRNARVAGDAEGDGDEMPAYSSKEAWLKEWLTPPPPVVG
jgi:hypothetical protein